MRGGTPVSSTGGSPRLHVRIIDGGGGRCVKISMPRPYFRPIISVYKVGLKI